MDPGKAAHSETMNGGLPWQDKEAAVCMLQLICNVHALTGICI